MVNEENVHGALGAAISRLKGRPQAGTGEAAPALTALFPISAQVAEEVARDDAAAAALRLGPWFRELQRRGLDRNTRAVVGSLDLTGTAITALPDNLSVGGGVVGFTLAKKPGTAAPSP